MKSLRISATVTLVLGSFALIALILMFLAFSDITKESDTTLEWKVVRVCYLELLLYTISTIITISLMMKVPEFWKGNILNDHKTPGL
jgi:hypothetical protein